LDATGESVGDRQWSLIGAHWGNDAWASGLAGSS
jgi:hypothetical protein